MMKQFNVGVKALIVRDDKILLVKRNGEHEYWDVPGGRIDDDESILQALDRELHEELPNIASYEVGQLAAAYRLHKDIKPDLSLVLLFYKVSAIFASNTITLSPEHSQYYWASREEAIQMGDIALQEALKTAF